jgi:hypothetical protein
MITIDPVRLDVRPLLAAGGEPFNLIMITAERVPIGGLLELTTPFEPVPLYQVMRRRGFVGNATVLSPGEWLVTFVSTGITPGTTLTEIIRLAPETASVLARHGLDLCCGGSKTLAVVASAHGIELDPLLAELQTAALPNREPRC